MASQEWVLQRNCSLSPRQLAGVYLALCASALAVAGFLAAHGAWYVLGFALLELMALGLAFLHFGRHAGDREHVVLDGAQLLVERVEGNRLHACRLDARALRVHMPGQRNGLVEIEARGVRVALGRHVAQGRRREFARQLQAGIATGNTSSTSSAGTMQARSEFGTESTAVAGPGGRRGPGARSS